MLVFSFLNAMPIHTKPRVFVFQPQWPHIVSCWTKTVMHPANLSNQHSHGRPFMTP